MEQLLLSCRADTSLRDEVYREFEAKHCPIMECYFKLQNMEAIQAI
jgi:hypothetical protein